MIAILMRISLALNGLSTLAQSLMGLFFQETLIALSPYSEKQFNSLTRAASRNLCGYGIVIGGLCLYVAIRPKKYPVFLPLLSLISLMSLISHLEIWYHNELPFSAMWPDMALQLSVFLTTAFHQWSAYRDRNPLKR